MVEIDKRNFRTRSQVLRISLAELLSIGADISKNVDGVTGRMD